MIFNSPSLVDLNTFSFMQVQALVGFNKTIEHLDDHLIDISTNVSYTMQS